MVSLIALGWAVALLAAPADAESPDPSRAVNQALGKAAPRWFDPAKDAIRPVAIPIDLAPEDIPSKSGRWPGLGGAGLGSFLPITAMVAALGALIGVLIYSWIQYRPIAEEMPASRPRGPGGARSVEELPEALRGGSADPWEDALRLRDRGERGPAVVRLFAHQLLTLGRLGLVRLVPGRTGRQLVRSVADAEFKALATTTLRSFESYYYGHREPTEAEFAALWTDAEAFQRRAAAGGMS
ncbi:DUF4129 domain-containing protein [Tundrisphaera sp. TA3]|uniref:DUF4129 domain-containing protein n=1 Tax=Tundrisphaera sp. TA3 TaxID=3435775 RepID=UPI003EC02980